MNRVLVPVTFIASINSDHVHVNQVVLELSIHRQTSLLKFLFKNRVVEPVRTPDQLRMINKISGLHNACTLLFGEEFCLVDLFNSDYFWD